MTTKTKTKECNVPGCDAKQYAKGVCKDHHQQNYFLGCSVTGCEKEVFAKGRCKPHYMRRYRKKKGEAAPSEDAPVRGYGQARFEVFTRIPQEYADLILKEAGRPDGMYEKAAEILVAYAKRRERASVAA